MMMMLVTVVVLGRFVTVNMGWVYLHVEVPYSSAGSIHCLPISL